MNTTNDICHKFLKSLFGLPIMEVSIVGGLMKKNLFLVILALGMVFSLGFVPIPFSQNAERANQALLKPTSSALVELSVTNQTKYRANVWIFGTQSYSIFMPPGPGVTRSIKVKPSTYQINISSGSGDCKGIGKKITITKKTSLSFACGKFK